MKTPQTVLGWAVYAAIAFGLVMLGTFTIGQVRGCYADRAPVSTIVTPPVVPGPVDPGVPTATPANTAPTDGVKLDVAVPRLSREEVLAAAARVGLKLAPATPPKPPGARTEPGAGAAIAGGSVGADVPGAGSGSTGAPSASTESAESAPAASTQEYPYMLGEQRFTFDAAGVAVNVQAWLLAPGERVTMRGVWDDYQPPPVVTCAPVPNPGRGGWLGAPARWEGMLGVGGAAAPDGAGLGGVLGIGYRGLKTGRLLWGIDAIAIPIVVDGDVTGAGIVAATTHIR